MQKVLLQEVEKYAKRNRRRRIWREIVRVMACVVVFCTTYALILPAITMEHLPCGLKEHTHSESCYKKVESEGTAILACSYEALGVHVHAPECYDGENQLICGQADYLIHKHDDNCVDENGTIVCHIPEVSAHEHSDACYQVVATAVEVAHVHGSDCYGTERGNLICQLTEEGHIHGEECSETILVCDLSEGEDHVHDADCYESLLTCELSEEPAHQHTDECYEMLSVLVCELEEAATAETQETVAPEQELICTEPAAQVHIHDEACFAVESAEDVLTCMLPEDENHTHSVICYGIWELTCDKEEHTHDLVCQNDPEADVETEEDWTAAFADVTLTGDWNKDLLAIAQTQLGYQESTRNYEVMEDGETIKGYSRYGDWYGSPYGDWCAMFVSFCLEYADVEGIPHHAGVQSWIEELKEIELYHTAEDYEPKIGDIVFYDWEDDDFSDHVGIVAEIVPATEEESAKIKAIEGNSDDCVQYVYYDVDDSRLMGYCDVAQAYEQYKLQLQVIERVYSDEFVTVRVTYSPKAGIPDEAELVVKKILPEEAELYDASYQEAQELLDAQTSDIKNAEIKDFQLYDISFQLDGEEIEPQAAVSVEISFPAVETEEKLEVSVVHYAEEGPELPEVQEAIVDDSGNVNAAFETESFSLFAVVTQETQVDSVVTMQRRAISSSSPADLADGKLYAISSGNYALNVNSEGELITEYVNSVTALANDGISAKETLARWKFTRNGTSGSNYYISTESDGKEYYLFASNGELSLTENAESSFTATRAATNTSSDNLSLQFGSGTNSYINLTASGVSLGSSSALSLCSVQTGKYQVLFDGKLGDVAYMADTDRYKYAGAEQRVVETDADGYVTLPESITSPTALNLRVVGWYDIINRVYYDESMLGQKIRVTGPTVFYPDYVAATYDIGQPSDLVTNQPDTSDFITTQLFDYNELFNVHSAKYTGEITTSNWKKTNSWSLDGGLGFVFSDWITPRSSYSQQDDKGSGNIGRVFELGNTNEDNSNDNASAKNNQFPGIIESGIMNSDRMAALFTPDDSFIGRHYIGTGDWLYSYDADTGFYYYNSARNAATYNQSAGRFYVHDYTQKINAYGDSSLNDFLPFNEGSGDFEYQQVNYWFGMKSEINFYLPADSGSPDNKAVNGEPLQFRFSGDDDVWVYIDGQPILDLGGVHDIVYGEINFANGTYKVAHNGATNTASSSSIGMPGTSGTSNVTTGQLPLIEGGQDHTLTVYYLERGSTLSNCAIYFNIAPLYELEIVKHDENGENLLEGATFQVFDDEACTNPSNLFTVDEEGNKEPQESFTTDENGRILCTGLLAGKTYYIKETVAPENFPDMQKYIIELNLSAAGKPTIILRNTHDDGWRFAEAHKYSETGHRVILTVYNAEFIGGEKEVYVEKAWADGAENHSGENIVVHLYANGEPTGHSMTLSEKNNWNGTFLNLPENDPSGNPYEYTVVEENTSGYIASYERVGQAADTEETVTGWKKVSSLTAGKTYLFVNGTNALSSTSSTGVAWVNAQAELSKSAGDSSNAQWTASANSSNFNLKSGSKYLNFNFSYISSNRYINTSTSNYPFNVDTNGRLYAQRSSNEYYLTGINSSNSRGNISTTASEGLQFTVYEWYSETETIPGHVPGWRITNTPITEEEYLSLSVQKNWDENVPADKQTEITMSLYTGVPAEDGTVGQLTWVKDAVLNAENGWYNTFDQLLPLTDANYYLVEKTQEFAVNYGSDATTVALTIDGQVYQAVQVTWPADANTVALTVTNTMPLIDIPVKKLWDGGVEEANKKETISVTLYAYDTTTSEVTSLQTIDLLIRNRWEGVFEDVPIPEDGVYYYVEEITPGYTVRYSKEAQVEIDGVSKTLGMVEFNEDGTPVVMTITNYVFYELPDTGGTGTTLYTMAGLVLMLLSMVYLMYRSKIRRREDV